MKTIKSILLGSVICVSIFGQDINPHQAPESAMKSRDKIMEAIKEAEKLPVSPERKKIIDALVIGLVFYKEATTLDREFRHYKAMNPPSTSKPINPIQEAMEKKRKAEAAK